jgi:hypothetical protein
MDPVRRIGDAVLYEGYLLWPYRKSAIKNQRRWTFGGVYPEQHSTAHPDDAAVMQTQCLVRAKQGCRVDVRVRFLHVVRRDLVDAEGNRRDELVVDGEQWVAWDEATEREVSAAGLTPEAFARELVLDIPAGESREEPHLVRSWRALRGTIALEAEPLAGDLHRLTVRISNTTPFTGDEREEALRQTFCSTHTVLRVEDGEFVSLTDPPEDLRAEAERCENVGTWPVLVGEEGEGHTMLSSPIILPDYPEVAPESPGDMFDAAEIDQLLRLGILSLTKEEKREMRAADPKAREILERTESLSPEELMRLHGTIREMSYLEGERPRPT